MNIMTLNSSPFPPKKMVFIFTLLAVFQIDPANSQEPPYKKSVKTMEDVLATTGGLKKGVGKAMFDRFNSECPNSYSNGAGANAPVDSPEIYCQFLARRTIGALIYDDLNQEARQLYSKMLPNDFKNFSSQNCGFPYVFDNYVAQGVYVEYLFGTNKDPITAYMCNFLVNPIENYGNNGSLSLSGFIESTKNTNTKNQIELTYKNVLIPIGRFNSEKNAMFKRIKNDFSSDNKAISCRASKEFDSYIIKEATLLKNATNYMHSVNLPTNLLTPVQKQIDFLEKTFGLGQKNDGC